MNSTHWKTNGTRISTYAENPETGLCEVEVLKHDLPEWHTIGYASLEDARQAAHDYYDQV